MKWSDIKIPLSNEKKPNVETAASMPESVEELAALGLTPHTIYATDGREIAVLCDMGSRTVYPRRG